MKILKMLLILFVVLSEVSFATAFRSVSVENGIIVVTGEEAVTVQVTFVMCEIPARDLSFFDEECGVLMNQGETLAGVIDNFDENSPDYLYGSFNAPHTAEIIERPLSEFGDYDRYSDYVLSYQITVPDSESRMGLAIPVPGEARPTPRSTPPPSPQQTLRPAESTFSPTASSCLCDGMYEAGDDIITTETAAEGSIASMTRGVVQCGTLALPYFVLIQFSGHTGGHDGGENHCNCGDMDVVRTSEMEFVSCAHIELFDDGDDSENNGDGEGVSENDDEDDTQEDDSNGVQECFDAEPCYELLGRYNHLPLERICAINDQEEGPIADLCPLFCEICDPCDFVVCHYDSQCAFDSYCVDGKCIIEPKTNDIECDDSNDDTINDVCTDGQCTGIQDPCLSIRCNQEFDCAYENGCSDGECLIEIRENGFLCDDDNDNTLNDQCIDGFCEGVPACHDAPVCSELVLSYNGDNFPIERLCVINDPDEGLIEEKCPRLCEICDPCDFVVCHYDSQCASDSYCVDGECIIEPKTNGIGCNDSNDNTINDVCVDGQCRGTRDPCLGIRCTQQFDCAYENGCSDGKCLIEIRENGFLCNDDNDSTLNDQCIDGFCEAVPACHDDLICSELVSYYGALNLSIERLCAITDPIEGLIADKCPRLCEICDPCDGVVCEEFECKMTSECIDGECTHKNLPVGTECDDKNSNTINDQCNDSGICEGEIDPCIDMNCSMDYDCQYMTGECIDGHCIIEYKTNGISCDDNHDNTEYDECLNGWCVGAPAISTSLPPSPPPPSPQEECRVCSEFSCRELNLKTTYGDVCATSKDVLGDCEEPKPKLMNFTYTAQRCEDAGMRLCTRTEVKNDATAGTGCNYDFELAWTSGMCGGDGISHWAVPGKSSVQAIFETCLDGSEEAGMRCCADEYNESSECCDNTI